MPGVVEYAWIHGLDYGPTVLGTGMDLGEGSEGMMMFVLVLHFTLTGFKSCCRCDYTVLYILDRKQVPFFTSADDEHIVALQPLNC